MAKIGMKATKNEKPEFKGYEVGEHLVRIQSIESGVSRNGVDFWKFVLVGDTLLLGHKKGRYTLIMYDTSFGRSDLYDLYVALGIDPEREDIDTDELIDSWFKIELAEGEPYNDKPQWDVVEIYSADTEEDEEDDSEDEEEDEWDI